MKLIEIVKRLAWPDGAVVVEQDAKGTLRYRAGPCIMQSVEVADVADDHELEVVTRGELVAAQIEMRRTVGLRAIINNPKARSCGSPARAKPPAVSVDLRDSGSSAAVRVSGQARGWQRIWAS